MKKEENKYIVPAIILAVIIGGSFMMVQFSKQKSIEKQVNIKIEAEKELQEQEILAEENRLLELAMCYDEAEEDWWEYIKDNGDEVADKEDFWEWNKHTGNEADKIKDRKIKQCNVMYKQLIKKVCHH